ncbi:hypothetical protein V5799_006514 [Amblyomma americanum]|uniref:Uncharacterized protein n=1 Tax=Amblyomma americanum TaxID=6943 RepID=A0AAQ4DW56_AMBAM
MSVAVQGAIGQANFLVSTLPLVIRKDLQDLDDLVGANFQELQDAVITRAKAFKKALGDYRRNIGKVLVETRLKVKQQGQELLDVLVKFEQNATSSVNRTVTLYQFILGVLLAAMAAIVLQYIAAIYSGLRRVKRGFCGLYMASWMLSTAVVLFQLLFPMALLVSTASLAVGTVFDRFLCFPAQHPSSPASLVIIDFLLTKTMEQARAVGRRHITVNAGALLTAPTLAQNGSSAQPVNSSWKQNISIDKCWDNTEEDTNKKTRTGSEATSPMSQQRMEQYVSSVMSPDEGERWRLYQEIGRTSGPYYHPSVNAHRHSGARHRCPYASQRFHKVRTQEVAADWKTLREVLRGPPVVLESSWRRPDA